MEYKIALAGNPNCGKTMFIVSITQDTSSVSESVQAMIFLENKSIILVR